MWQDMVLYWAWRGQEPKEGVPPTPTKKRIEYAEILGPGLYLNGPDKGEPIRVKLAITVFDDGTKKEINREELEWYRTCGSDVSLSLT